MRFQSFALACLTLLSVFSMLQAQDQPSFPTATPEHQWLQKFVGEWETEAEGTAGPDQPPIKMTGNDSGSKAGRFLDRQRSGRECTGRDIQGPPDDWLRSGSEKVRRHLVRLDDRLPVAVRRNGR